MPQFLLTKKFATDCKITQLIEPVVTAHPLDDWFIDRMIVNRKKIAMITHGKSTFTFFIPYADAGGAKEIVAYFINQLKDLFQRNSLPALALDVDKLFAENPIFTILGHMNDFKRCATPYSDDPYPVDWQDTAERTNNMPIKGGSTDWLYPVERLNELLAIDLPKRKSGFSPLE
jgi:hypothetical protein